VVYLRNINASDFKAKCLCILDQVRDSGPEMVITQPDKPIARLVPIKAKRTSLPGAWKGSASIRGDIFHLGWTTHFKGAR
jgi:antitoxin (DNA-binding transcriptional repressor) of toxin-antitoxin stability system